MAKPKKQIKKIELNFITFLKELTQFLNKDNYDIKIILNLIEKYDVSPQFLFKRLIAYSYNNPYIIWYVNKYMNSKFEFYKYDVENILISVKYLLKTNNHNRLFFFKAKDFKDENKSKVKVLLKEYYSTINRKYLNDLELNHLYLMFSKNVITIDDLQKMNQILNGENTKFSISENTLLPNIDPNKPQVDTAKIEEYINYHISKLLPDNIYSFITELQEKKNQLCEKCPLFSKTMISLDTNVPDFQPVDFMFIMLNPGNEEVTYKKLCVGKSGKLLRSNMFQLNPKISWVITNVIQCNTATQKDIGKTEKAIKLVANKCRPFLDEITKKFPAKYYVLVGKHSMESFGIKGSITQKSGSIQTVNNNVVIPLIHPSSLIRNDNNRPVYDKSWQAIYQIANKLTNSQADNNKQIDSAINKQTQPEIKVSTNKYNIDDSKLITVDIIPEDMTYFDSVNLDGNEILNIFIQNKTCTKFYQIVEYKVPIFIKNITDYKECNMLNQGFESVTYVNGWNKYKLSKALKDNLIKHQYAALSQKG